MKRRHLNWMLLAVLVVTIAAAWQAGSTPSEPNAEFLPEMVRSPAYGAFEANPNFADGKTLRQPVAGTIPRGAQPLHYQATEEDRKRAGRELDNPYSAGDRQAVSRGAEHYARMCTPCHGAGGAGDGPVALRGYPPPPSLLADGAVDLKDGGMFHIITYGKGNMPPHAAQISREDRWKIILHIRSMQESEQAGDSTPEPDASPGPR